MNPHDDKIGEVLSAIAFMADARNSRLTKIRLVKFLYLLDLYFAQAKQTTYTEWEWAFVHYGPYCRASTDAIDNAVSRGYLAAEAYESNFRDDNYRLYSPGGRLNASDADRIIEQLPPHVGSCIRSAVQRWHDDTHGLLDYVYFRTGPMRSAKPGTTLSFTEERMPDYQAFRPVKMLGLSEAKKRAAREAIRKLREKVDHQSLRSEIYDDEYRSFVEGIAGSETPVGLSGTAKVNFGDSGDD